VTIVDERNKDDAFVISINGYKLKLYRMAYAYLGNEQDALEAVQETTCRAFVNFGKLKDTNHFGTWIMRILMNYCVDEQKRRKRNLPLPEEPRGADSLDDGNLVLRQALRQLEPKQRQVVFLKYFGGLTTREIADTLGYPEGTVKTRLYRGLAFLKTLLKEVEANV
jgi:RNA polymerase sigma factor (sigma-70 family)